MNSSLATKTALPALLGLLAALPLLSSPASAQTGGINGGISSTFPPYPLLLSSSPGQPPAFHSGQIPGFYTDAAGNRGNAILTIDGTGTAPPVVTTADAGTQFQDTRTVAQLTASTVTLSLPVQAFGGDPFSFTLTGPLTFVSDDTPFLSGLEYITRISGALSGPGGLNMFAFVEQSATISPRASASFTALASPVPEASGAASLGLLLGMGLTFWTGAAWRARKRPNAT